MTSTELEPVQHTGLFRTDQPQGIIEQATSIAEQLATVIRQQRLAVGISGREHVKVEGWTLLGTLLGVHPETVWSRTLTDPDGQWIGYEARVEARTLDGRLVGAAESECTTEERTWKTRDRYALRSMAQTRATSKALRQPLGFVMALAGFDPTPADEMPRDSEVRARIAVGPEVTPYDVEPGPDFGPIDDEQPSGFQAPEREPGVVDKKPLTHAQLTKINGLLDQLKATRPDLYTDRNIQDQLQLTYGKASIDQLARWEARELRDRLERRIAGLT